MRFCLFLPTLILALLTASCRDKRETIYGAIDGKEIKANAGTGMWLVTSHNNENLQSLLAFVQEHDGRRALYTHHFQDFKKLIQDLESTSPIMRNISIDSNLHFSTDVTNLPTEQKNNLFVFFYIYNEKPQSNGRFVTASVWLLPARPEQSVIVTAENGHILLFNVNN